MSVRTFLRMHTSEELTELLALDHIHAREREEEKARADEQARNPGRRPLPYRR